MLPLLYPCSEINPISTLSTLHPHHAMVPLQQHSTESFSLRWMTNLNTSSHICSRSPSFDSFIEMDHGFISMPLKDFDFGIPDSQDTDLVLADDIFANGIMLPLSLEGEVVPKFSDSNLSRALSIDSSQRFLAQEHLSKSWPMFCTFLCCPYRDTKQKLGKCLGSPRKKLQKYLFFLVPLYRKVKGLRMNPSKSPAVMSTEYCYSSSIADNRIYDAILHCKKPIVS